MGKLIFAYLCQLPELMLFSKFKGGNSKFFCQFLSIFANAELAFLNL